MPRRLFAVLVLTVAACPAVAETAAECHARLKDPVECFLGKAAFQLKLCSMKIELSMLQGGMDESCISEGMREVKSFYEPAARVFAKKPSTLSMLKDAYAFWQASMHSLSPRVGEPEALYKRRLEERERGFNEKMHRIRLEK
jgi:hypothetical protein